MFIFHACKISPFILKMRNSNDYNVFAQTLKTYCRVLERYCKFPLQILLGFIPTFGIGLGVFAVINFNVTFQYRFPAHNLTTEEGDNPAIPALRMWTSALARIFCSSLKLTLRTQLSSDLVKCIINKVLMSWNLLIQLVFCHNVDLLQQIQGLALTKCLRKLTHVQ